MKRIPTKLVLKALSPKTALRVVESFDRVTTLVVGVSWAAAAIMIGFAVYTVNLTVHAKHDADLALVAEPVLPKIVHKKVEARDVKSMMDQLQHRYPTIIFSFKNNFSITSADGAHFHDWLGVLSYIDTISPQYHWALSDFCVGKCGNAEIMQATLNGDKVFFEKPQDDSNH